MKLLCQVFTLKNVEFKSNLKIIILLNFKFKKYQFLKLKNN